MFGTLLFNLIAVFFAWLESARIFKHGLKFSLFTVFLFLALRYDFGNDYMGYLENFLFVNSFSVFDATLFRIKGNELGWLYLNRFSGPIGFFGMTALLAAFTGIVLYRFIKNYVPPQYYWFAVFVYVFSPYQMLVLSSAMRQAVGVVLFLLAVDFIVNKKVIWYLLLITLATLFHSSAAFLYPLILLAYINWKIRFRHLLIVGLLFVILIIYRVKLFEIIESAVVTYFDYYEVYTRQVDFGIGVGLGFALMIMIRYFMFFYMQNDRNNTHNVLYKIIIISFLIIPLGFGVQLIGRLNFYLAPVLMAVYPIVFLKIRNPEVRLGFIGVVVIFILYGFFSFFQSPVWEKAFGTYQTIFSAPGFY